MPKSTNPITVEVLQEFADAWNRHDANALMAFMSEDCMFEASAGPDAAGTRYIGREAVRAGFSEVWVTYPDAQWSDARHFICGDRGVSEWTFTGTRADGGRILIRVVAHGHVQLAVAGERAIARFQIQHIAAGATGETCRG